MLPAYAARAFAGTFVLRRGKRHYRIPNTGEVAMRKLAFKTLAASAVAAIFATGAYAGAVLSPDSDEELVPTGKGWGQRAQPGHANPNAKPSTSGINYHGGPLMLGTTNVYYIWYGNWTGNSATTILNDLASNIGGSPYFNINTSYYDGNNTHVTNAVRNA